MSDRALDTLARGVAQARGRRALLGLFTGAVLTAIATQPATAKGGKPIGGGGGHGGKNKKCKKDAKECRTILVPYCALAYPEDPLLFAVCFDHYNQLCCIPLGTCQRPAPVCF